MSEPEPPARPETRTSGRSSPHGRTSAMGRFYIVLAVVALLGVGAVGYNVTWGRTGQAASVPLDLAVLDDPDSLVAMARGVTKGDPNAAVTVLEFGDYQCPGCGQFARDFKPAVELALVETGRAKFVFHDYPLVNIHPHAFVAARAARCAEDQERFWEYHDHLYREQARWTVQEDPLATFEGYAEELGLDAGDFRACLNSDRHADVVTANLRLAEAVGVPRTPTILVNVAGRGTRESSGWDAAAIIATIELLEATPPAN
ncbi:MAG: DsbA family protein [Gemmatimonadales bacterium]